MALRNKDLSTREGTGINKFFDIHKPVFWPAIMLILALIIITWVLGDQANAMFSTAQTAMSETGGWFFVLSVNIFLLFSLFLAFSKLGNIRIGGKEAKPEFSNIAWFAMLFSAGMGIGIMFWSVAEPIFHFTAPPMAEAESLEAAREAMGFTFMHWGFHAWGIYAVVALSLAFFAFNRGLPLSFRSVFQPVLGDRINGWMGDLVDILAVLATLFGLATSLGLGVQQISAGLNHLFELPDTVWMQVGLILGITMIATISVILGLDKGVKVLSEFNIRTAAIFLLFVIIVGPTIFIFDSFVQNTGYYLQNVANYMFWTESYEGSTWQNDWTVFYWAWWISWSPYVGMFIARISKGRTVKEFILGVLIVPSILTFLWLTAFGGTSINLALEGVGTITEAVNENVATALFVFLEELPISFITSLIAIILVISFFVTSSDSGSLVIDGLTSGGKLESPVGQRIFWAQTEGIVAAVLLIGGGLNALQAASITTGLPFALILLLMCYSLYRGLNNEYQKKLEGQRKKERQSYQDLIKKLVTGQKKSEQESNQKGS